MLKNLSLCISGIIRSDDNKLSINSIFYITKSQWPNINLVYLSNYDVNKAGID